MSDLVTWGIGSRNLGQPVAPKLRDRDLLGSRNLGSLGDAWISEIREGMGGAGREAGMVKTCMAMMRFVKWFLDGRAASGASGLEADTVEKLKKYFGSHHNVWTQFWNGEIDAAATNLDFYLKDKVFAFAEREYKTNPPARLCSLFLYKVMAGYFLDDFVYLATNPALTLEEFLQKDASHEVDALRTAYQEFLDKCAETACGVIDRGPNDGHEFVPGDEDSEARAELHAKAMKLRRDHAQFHSTGGYLDANALYQSGGKVSQIFQTSRSATFVGEAGKVNGLMMCSADMLPTSDQFGKAESYKHLFVGAKDLAKPLEWMTKARGPATIVVGLDGRDNKLRRVLEDWAESSCKDSQRHIQGSILYKPPAASDPRFPGRKLAYSANYREEYVGILPVGRSRFKAKPRDHFTACGEKTSHEPNYTGVALRSLWRAPKLTRPDKQKLTGVAGPLWPDEVFTMFPTGEPLFWLEMKDVLFWVALFKDLSVSHIFDLTPGSGAAAIAAMMLRLKYDGCAFFGGPLEFPRSLTRPGDLADPC